MAEGKAPDITTEAEVTKSEVIPPDIVTVETELGSATAVKNVDTSDNKRYCWVCFATEDEDAEANWVQPCRCKGTTRWVHQSCLQRWIDEKQRGNVSTHVTCPQCSTQYLIVFPQFGHIAYIMDMADRTVYKACPFIAAGVVVGSVYWTAVTYGAVTVMQVLGHKEGLSVMEQADPLFLLVGLPTIPIMLILGRMVRWEDYVLRLWRRHSGRIPGLKYLLHSFNNGELGEVNQSSFTDPMSATRVLCGALVLPTVAAICGKMIFSNVTSSLQRTLLGGIFFVTVKGAMKIYLKQQQYNRQYHRQVLNFDTQSAVTQATPASASSA